MRRKIIPYNPKLKEHARQLRKNIRKNMTFAEVLLWNKLKRKQLLGYDFDRQRPIDEYIVDFYCKDLMLAIEIDGETHNRPLADVRDQRRQRRLESLGVRFLRFTDLEVRQAMDAVLQRIESWILEHGKGTHP